MKILSLAAGAAGMYCGSCLRDNALAAELVARGHDVTLVPLYTPLLTDEPNVTRNEVLFGGISVYLQQYSPIFRRVPRFLDRLLDQPWLISAFADRSVSTNPRVLGGLTISMLEGRNGVLGREFDKLVEWVRGESRPDVVNLPNSLLIALARPLAEALGRPVCCTLSGEELFIGNLPESYRGQAVSLIRRQVAHVERFIAVSDYSAAFMADYLLIPSERISVVPLGVRADEFQKRTSQPGDPFRVGYLARVAPEKGLHVLADAFIRLKHRHPGAAIRLEVAGYLAPADKRYLAGVDEAISRAGLSHDFTYHGALDRKAKIQFLAGLDLLSVPATYDEPKGLFLLEALASAIPVVQPRRGSFTEVVERTGGGLLVAPDDRDALAEAIEKLWSDPTLARQLGRRGREGVRASYTIQRSADRLLETYTSIIGAGRPGAPHPMTTATGR
jgi:glycosyltransferase involved in cell wall biosynthesis